MSEGRDRALDAHHLRRAPQTTPPTESGDGLEGISSTRLDDERHWIPPTDPGGELQVTLPTDPGDESQVIPPTDPGDESQVIPPTDPGDELQVTPPTDPGEYPFEPPPTEPKLHLHMSVASPSALSDSESLRSLDSSLTQLFVENMTELIRGKWGTFCLISVLCLFYIMTVGRLEGPVNLASAIEWGANFAPKTNGSTLEWWRLLTAPLLHWDLQHLLFNLGPLLFLAVHIEHLLGSLALGSLFISSATLAGAFTLIYYPSQVSMGSSGGVYGLFGVIITLLLLTKGKRIAQTRSATSVMIIWLIYSLAENLSSPWVDNASHLGGAFSGLVLGVFCAPLYKYQELSLKQRALYTLSPLLFSFITISVSWSFLPTPHPVFSMLEKYSREVRSLDQSSITFDRLLPLDQRVVWETKLKPSLALLDQELQNSAQGQPRLERSELKTTTEATQWVLRRLLKGWWHHYGQRFEDSPNHLKLSDSAHVPFRVARRLYESLFAQQAIINLIEPSWDERITAIKSYLVWSEVSGARKLLSEICAELVEEASSPRVRRRGSLWGQAEVREERFTTIESTLLNSESLRSPDYVTLNRIEWLRGELSRVIESSARVLHEDHIHLMTLESSDKYALTQLLYQSLLSSPQTHLDQPPVMTYSKQRLSVSAHQLPQLGRLYLSAELCRDPKPNAERG